MVKSKTFWKLFETTGHIGAYLLYKDYNEAESGVEIDNSDGAHNLATGGEI